jgi:hypothetical protein
MDGRERCRRHPHGARGDRQVALERQAAAHHARKYASRFTTSTSCAASCRRRTRIPTTCAR